MSEAEEITLRERDTTRDFLRSFSVVDYDSEEEFDILSPIPETPGGPTDQIDHGPSQGRSSDFGEQIIPFKTIFEPSGTYSSTKTNFWLPGQPVTVTITESEREEIKLLNPNLYHIEVKHGEHEWTVKRRYKHFRQLHDALLLFRAKYSLPLPRTGGRRERQKTLKREWQKQDSVRLPRRPDALLREDDVPERRQQLEKYLQNLLLCKSYRNHPETLKFFEVSHLSFVARLGPKSKEGLVNKCSGGRRISIGCCGCLQKVHFAGTWNKRWLVLKDTYLAYVRPEDGVISDVMLMDKDFKVECGMKATGAKHGVLISNLNRNLLVKCWTSRKAREWADHIESTASKHAYDFTTTNRFHSFAPPRDESFARWFVDTRGYFEAVADAIEKAKEEIYITDWWLSPEIYMKRPMVEGDKWRLDVILERKASQGVKVFILLYKEVEAALMIKSIYSKKVLMGKHENIKVLRHPDHIPGKGVLLWAHHEKLVAIDQQIAFVGGIDLCYGRWDDSNHRLTDLGSIILNAPTSPPSPTPASEVSNQREDSHVTDFTELTDDLRSVDSPLSLRPLQNSPTVSKTKATTISSTAATAASRKPPSSVSHNDVNISIIPASPMKGAGAGESSSNNKEVKATQESEDIIVKEDASKHHVFAHVVLTSENQQQTAGGESTTDSPIKTSEDKTTQQLNDRSLSAESTTSTSSFRRHLWGNSKSGRLKLKIPSRSSEDEPPPDQHPKTAPVLVEMDRLEISNHNEKENGRVRSSSNTSDVSKNSESELITKEETVELRGRPPSSAKSDPGGGARDTLDFKGAAGVMNLLSKKAKQEENNNQGRNCTNSDIPMSPNTVARRRWKMVFNVQKFESTVRQVQTDRVSAELLMPAGDKKKKTKSSHSFYHIWESKFRGDRRGSFDLSRAQRGDKYEDEELGVYRTHSQQDILERGLQGATRLWIGKDYVNFIHKDFIDLDNPFQDFIDRTKTPRMPWHDIGAMVYGKAARDIARHFITRWNFTKLEKYKRSTFFPLLLPKTYPKMTVPQSIKDITFGVQSQVLRSLCGWSGGIESVETSIQEAYEFCIESAKNYIYIENQFFITQVEDMSIVSNCIGMALYKRILRAHRNQENFKVYVMMPLLPAFEGEFGTTSGTAIQAITHWNFASICRGGNSLIQKLAQSEVPDPEQYIVFGGLRTWDKLDNKLVTELIYIHSKLMIVDDNTVILGSANINDRSMLGRRDSELAMIFRDTEREKIHLNGNILEPGPFASSMRHTLFREHLGLTEGKDDVDLRDVSSDAFFENVWKHRADVNTNCFDEVFNCVPTDKVHNFQELREYNLKTTLATTEPDAALTRLAKVKGHLVFIPLHFLEDESLAPKRGQKEALLPASLWT